MGLAPVLGGIPIIRSSYVKDFLTCRLTPMAYQVDASGDLQTKRSTRRGRDP